MESKNNTFSVTFFVKRAKAKNGKFPIYARITVDGRRSDISIKREVEEQNWNAAKGMIKGIKDEIKALGAYLEQFRSMVVGHYQQMVLEKKMITCDGIKNKVLGKELYEHTLCSLVKYHNTQMPDLLSPGTMKNYYTTERYIKKFLKEKIHTSDIFLVQLDYKFITDFDFFLRKHKLTEKQKQLTNNGVMKHIERLRKMVTLSTKLGWLPADPFIQYRLKFTKVDKDFLSEEELAKLEVVDLSSHRLTAVRDLFVFSCYTGLAYTDVMNLTPSNIHIGIDKEYWLITQRQKTDTDVKVPLLPQALSVIDRYRNHPRAVNKGSLFPLISNQKLNKYLKEVAEKVGISKDLTFHCARHTFATTVTLSNGVPIESVSEMLGHTKISTTQIYARVIEQKLSVDMKALKARLVPASPLSIAK